MFISVNQYSGVLIVDSVMVKLLDNVNGVCYRCHKVRCEPTGLASDNQV